MGLPLVVVVPHFAGALRVINPLRTAMLASPLWALPVMLESLRHAAYHSPIVMPVFMRANRRLRSPEDGLRAPETNVMTLAVRSVVSPGLWVEVSALAAGFALLDFLATVGLLSTFYAGWVSQYEKYSSSHAGLTRGLIGIIYQLNLARLIDKPNRAI